MNSNSITLRSALNFTPVPLKFGTSGRRGLVADLTQLEVYLNALAELEYLQSLPLSKGGIRRGEKFYFACDLRPSSSGVVKEKEARRGGLVQAVAQAIADAGMQAVFLGLIPTPALASYAFTRGRGSMMITGSHIPFDRNGYKTNTACGELLKRDELPIQAKVEDVRARIYAQPLEESPFGADGILRKNPAELSPLTNDALRDFLGRYTNFFAGKTLRGMRLLVYQHSAVGRDWLVELLRCFGAEVIAAGRSDVFVPIDTEAIDAEQLFQIETLTVNAWKRHGPIDAVVSLDGDSDRPLILGVEPVRDPGSDTPCRVKFFGGDLLGMVVADYLKVDAVVVPVSCNDAVDRGPLKDVLEPKTRIGSPFVIAGMQRAVAAGCQAVCGWEANGGFLLGSNLERNEKVLAALPTRDAFLPIIAVLLRAKEENVRVSELFDALPRRFSRADLLKNFPRDVSERIIHRLTLAGSNNQLIDFAGAIAPALLEIQAEVARFFTPGQGFGSVEKMDYTDGVRIYFSNGDVAHVRPSGNADELRIYAVADSQSRADDIANQSVAEPDGILRRLEAAVTCDRANPDRR